MAEDTSLENLRKFLESDDPAMVRMGISLAKRADVEVTVKDLEHFLKSEDVETIKTGIMLADEAGVGDEAMEILCKTLEAEKQYWGHHLPVAKALGEIGGRRAVEQLLEVIDYGNHERIEETVRQSDIFDWDISIAAAKALGKIGDADTVEPLINMFEMGASNRYEDRSGWPAAIALGAIGDSRAVKPLLNELWNVADDLDDPNDIREGGRIPEWYACQVVPEALIQIGDKSVIESLIGFVHYPDDWWVPELAAEALTGLGWKPETEDLKAAYFVATKDWEGCKQLGKLGTEKAIEYLVPLLYYRDSCHGFGYHHEIEEAFESFGEMAIEPLIKLLVESEFVVISEALRRIGEPVVEPLIKMLSDDELKVRDAAKKALHELGHE